MALRNQPFLPLFVDDFLSDEKLAECSAESTGVYIRIMCLMHKSESYGCLLLKQKDKQKESKIENFAFKLLRHLPYSYETILASLEELTLEKVLSIEGDKLFQKRMVKDGKVSEMRSISGQKGGKTTKEKYHSDSSFALANSLAKEQANAVTVNGIDNIDSNRERDKVLGKEETPFELFWKAYPFKSGREAARLEFEALPEELHETIIKAVEQQKKWATWKEEGGKYIPKPAKWLSGGCWEDEPVFNPETEKEKGGNARDDSELLKKLLGGEDKKNGD
ncbi:MAG: hypothetical protein RSA62_05940 [Oscillospiraceae bacterium]